MGTIKKKDNIYWSYQRTKKGMKWIKYLDISRHVLADMHSNPTPEKFKDFIYFGKCDEKQKAIIWENFKRSFIVQKV